MVKLIIVFLSISLTPLVWADESKITGYIKRDPIRGANHYLISNDGAKVKARIKPDPLWPGDSGRYLIINDDGNESGRIRPGYLNKDQYIIETFKDD